MPRRPALVAAVLLGPLLIASCARDPQTADERRRVGRDWLRQVDSRLGQAPGVSVAIRGTRQRIREGETTTVPFTIDLVTRAAGGIHFRQVAAGLTAEAWYDGTTLTLSSGAAPAERQITRVANQGDALSRVAEGFQVEPALTALFAVATERTLVPEGSTGGWRGREHVGGLVCEHLAYQHPDRDVALWIASSGDALPQRLVVTTKDAQGQVTSDLSFANWNLAPASPDDVFTPPAPDGN